MKLWLVLLVLLFSSLPGLAQTLGQSISLQKMALPANGRPARMSNLFFAKPDNKQVHYPPDWKQVEISPVMENAALAPVYVIRFQESGGSSYVVDTNADLDFQNESKLRFREIDELKFADFEVTVQARAPKQGASTKVSYQIILARDGYVYARISEYRVGEIRIAGKTFGLDLHARNRNYPLFDLSGSTVYLIDLNHDGVFSPFWRLSESGDALPREEIDISSPFILSGDRLRVVDLDPAGTNLRIEPSTEEVSISVGFKAPAFSLKGLDHRAYGREQLKGKIVLLEFWSVNCPVCKRVLPEVNSLVKRVAGKDLVALDVTREESVEEINSNLRENPREATVTLFEKSAWETYNRQTITPTFYLIDHRGIIRFSGHGAASDQLKVIERMIEQIRKEMDERE
jgi:thiol-disulfide isomerase/thioredoxin